MRRDVAPLGPMLAWQCRAELLRLWRTPAFSATSLVLPVMLYGFFGLPDVGRGNVEGVDAGVFMLASMGAYATLNVVLFAFGLGVAVERGQNIDVLLRATPLSPVAALLAKVLTALLFGLCTLVVLFAFAFLAGGVRLPALTWIDLTLRLLLGSLPFVALGFAIGYSTEPRAAPGVVNLIYLPMAFASGLFLPIERLPGFVQSIAPYLPTYRYAQLAWGAVGAQSAPALGAVLWLLGYGVLLFALAWRAYQRVEAQKFG